MNKPLAWFRLLFLSFALMSLAVLAGCSGDRSNSGVFQPALSRLVERANALKNEGKTSEAICRLESAVELAPDNPRVLYNLGVLYTEANRWEAAIAKLEQSVEIDPKQPAALFSLALAYESRGDELMTPPAPPAGAPAATAAPEAVNPEAGRPFYEKAIATYRDYLKVAPQSDPSYKDAQSQLDRLQTRLQQTP